MPSIVASEVLTAISRPSYHPGSGRALTAARNIRYRPDTSQTGLKDQQCTHHDKNNDDLDRERPYTRRTHAELRTWSDSVTPTPGPRSHTPTLSGGFDETSTSSAPTRVLRRMPRRGTEATRPDNTLCHVPHAALHPKRGSGWCLSSLQCRRPHPSRRPEANGANPVRPSSPSPMRARGTAQST